MTTELGQRIVDRLKELKKSPRAASLNIGPNAALLRDIINGKVKNPRSDTLAKIADELEMPIDLECSL